MRLMALMFATLFVGALFAGVAPVTPAQATHDTPLGQFFLALAEASEDNSSSQAIEPRLAAHQSSNSFSSWFGNSGLPRKFRRTVVPSPGKYSPGTIVINTAERYLYHIQADGTALRYGVGVGRQGFSWKGGANVGHKAEWPGWTPPAAMRAREPWLPAHMPGGPENPLGARALYLYKDGKDTLYRIHGTNQPETIGQALSSGCIRMLNEDVEHLYDNVRRGARVVVI